MHVYYLSRPLIKFLANLFLFLFLFLLYHCKNTPKGPRILVLSKPEFTFHESTQPGIKAMGEICRRNGIGMDVTEESEEFTEEKLRQYAAVVFLNTAGDIFNGAQEKEFQKYIHAGGGFVGIHTAVDTEQDWYWYRKLIGADYEDETAVQNAQIRVENHRHPATRLLDSVLSRKDSWLNVKNISPDIHVLLTREMEKPIFSFVEDFRPVSWYHDFENGRVFVTTMGHTKESYADPLFLKHLEGAIEYAIGDRKIPDYTKTFVSAEVKPPSAGGLIKTVVASNLYEPMEMDKFPDGKILFIERRGTLKLFDPGTGETREVAKLDVFSEHEEGLLGLAIDPHWEENHWIYLYYTHGDDNSAIRLSRFEFKELTLIKNSEKVLLKVATLGSPNHFHAAGGLQFDAEGNLYIATGDNSPHSDGYAVIDERPGQESFDSQKSSSNSMDLRGKILRIRPMPDGSYVCPSGNIYVNRDTIIAYNSESKTDKAVFFNKIKGRINPVALAADGSPSTLLVPADDPVYSSYGRPEIYIMGLRNPFRISYDDRIHALYFADVGPDASVYDSIRGPEGYDEINIAFSAGNYGWPYFIGPNKAYRNYDYQTRKASNFFDPLHPVNKSPNNTGTTHLPPARKPGIWYPFARSKEFPLLQNGTRCGLVGPTYYCDQYPKETRLPDRFDGRVFIYDFMRNWIMAVKFDAAGNYITMDPLPDQIKFTRPIDMMIDKNGSVWVLEYGLEWYMRNKDACLSRIDYKKEQEEKEGSQREAVADKITWNFFEKNRSFYTPGEKILYRIEFSNPDYEKLTSFQASIRTFEAGSGAYRFALKTSLQNIKNYTPEGQLLIDQADCKACHSIDKQINGPSYQSISARYRQDQSVINQLTTKIINGGSGNWGDRPMIPHPGLDPKQISEMVTWILSLKDNANLSIPKEGRISFNMAAPSSGKDVIYVCQTYLENEPSETVLFRPALQESERADTSSGKLKTYTRKNEGKNQMILEMKNGSFVGLKGVDLYGIQSIDFSMDLSGAQQHSERGMLNVYLDSLRGLLLGNIKIPPMPANKEAMTLMNLQTDASKWPHDHTYHKIFFQVTGENSGSQPVIGLDWIRFNLK